MENQIKRFALSRGADVCGVASIERFSCAPEVFSPTDVYAGCRSVISVGMSMPKGTLEVSPRIVYGYFSDQICRWLDRVSYDIARMLEREYGAVGVPLPCDTPYDYWDAELSQGKGIISMKHAAMLCGLGMPGKSSLLLNPEYGNLLIVGAVLTDLELRSDALSEAICIEGCTQCVDSCPGHAIRPDGTVDQSLCRPHTCGTSARGFSTIECCRCRSVCPMRYGKQNKRREG